ncbi:ParB/RepB/Spo0J family partition protein [Micromonospora aurantiaca]|uniref:ParB/RepB/Spo0J family partition protein n=1 Tax=Micromonospora aurantiaca (nom. illeg.) TaxID=47850 RepID=UPI001E65BF6F|nr:ParB/RepB/Spo0J family partition protein [Micromonospora aurantiaca]UFN92411.1 ParB/RepB/Spo0J family partition protein [Micromonospora aurantiaca]
MTATATAKRTAKGKQPVLRSIPVAKIEADPDQPRKQFTEEELAELATSMQKLGQLQPVAVRKTTKAGHYRLVVGERRWRAAQQGGIEELAAMVWEMDDETAFIAQVAENVNRQDMTPMEEAAAYQRLAQAGWETEAIADLFGKSQPYIGWRIDLLGLIDDAKALVAKGQMQVGVAWYVCRLSADQQRRFLVKWARGEFRSARDAEEFAKACKLAEEQAGFFQIDEEEHSEEKQAEVVAKRKKVTSKIDRLAAAGEILAELAAMDAEELAKVLAGADGGVAAYRQRVDHLRTAAGKVSAKLRKAQALAASVTVELDPEVVVEVPAEVVDVAPVPEVPVNDGSIKVDPDCDWPGHADAVEEYGFCSVCQH